MVPAEVRRQRIDARLRLLEAQALVEPPDEAGQEADVAGGFGKGICPVSRGCERLRVAGDAPPRVAETGREHAHDFVGVVVETEDLAEDLRVPAEGAPPERIADDDGLREPRRLVPGV